MSMPFKTYYLVKMNHSQSQDGYELYSRTSDLIMANTHAEECREKYPRLTGLIITKEVERLEKRII